MIALRAGEPLAAEADFSLCRQYRYRLSRTWNWQRPSLGYVMLNPSKASGTEDDATIRVIAERARREGYGGIIVGNLYAWVSTDPKGLIGHPDPVGRDNDHYLRRLAEDCLNIVLAWGAHADPARAQAVVELLLQHPAKPRLYHLGKTAEGMPRHPLRVGYDVELAPW